MMDAPLTNLTIGGDGMPGCKWNEEQKDKLRQRVFTDEHKKKIALSKIGNQISEEARKKISDANKGRELSAEHLQKLVASHTGRSLSDEHKEKIAKAHKGRVFSEDTRRKMSEAQKKIDHGPLSEAHRRNLSLAKIGKPQLCGICKSPDHNRRTCPHRRTTDAAN